MSNRVPRFVRFRRPAAFAGSVDHGEETGFVVDPVASTQEVAMSDRITQGDVQAVLEASGSGGWAIRSHSEVAEGSPADVSGSHGAIRPFAPWRGRQFCAEDWHVILVADIEGGDASFSHSDAEGIMSNIDVRFELDGVVLETTRTAIKPFLNPGRFGMEVAYYFQEGRVMSPDDLTVGRHKLRLVMSDGSGHTFTDTITFVIDAAGEGACA